MRNAILLVPLALAVAACGKKDAVEDTGAVSGAVTGGTTESIAGSTAGAPAGAAAAAVDANAKAALGKMGSYLRSLKTFQVVAKTTRDEVLESGQAVQYATVSDILARRPDRLRVEMTGDRLHRLLLYNGKQLTVYAGRLNYYATVPAPSTIAGVVDQLQQKYDIDMPLRDLFEWGTDQSRTADISAAVDLGPSPIEGTSCQHFALRQEGLDWQVWIQNGDFPLPRKLVLTTLTDNARPQYSAVLTWNLAPSFNDAAFTFDPPPGAHPIVLEDLGAGSAGKK